MIQTNYIFPICSSCRTTNYLLAASNSLSDHDLSLQEIKEFLSQQKKEVLIPSHIFERADFHQVLLFLKDTKKTHIAISAPLDFTRYQDIVFELVRNDIHIDILFQEFQDLENILLLPESFLASNKIRWLLLAHKSKDLESEIKKISKVIQRNTFFCFLYNTDANDIYFSKQETEVRLSKISRTLEHGNFDPKILLIDSLSANDFRTKIANLSTSEKNSLKFAGQYILRDLIRIIYAPQLLLKAKFLWIRNTFLIFLNSSIVWIKGRLYTVSQKSYYYAVKFYFSFEAILKLIFYRLFVEFLFYSIIMRAYHFLPHLYYQRTKVFFPLYKIYWIVENRLKHKKNEKDGH